MQNFRSTRGFYYNKTQQKRVTNRLVSLYAPQTKKPQCGISGAPSFIRLSGQIVRSTESGKTSATNGKLLGRVYGSVYISPNTMARSVLNHAARNIDNDGSVPVRAMRKNRTHRTRLPTALQVHAELEMGVNSEVIFDGVHEPNTCMLPQTLAYRLAAVRECVSIASRLLGTVRLPLFDYERNSAEIQQSEWGKELRFSSTNEKLEKQILRSREIFLEALILNKQYGDGKAVSRSPGVEVVYEDPKVRASRAAAIRPVVVNVTTKVRNGVNIVTTVTGRGDAQMKELLQKVLMEAHSEFREMYPFEKDLMPSACKTKNLHQ